MLIPDFERVPTWIGGVPLVDDSGMQVDRNNDLSHVDLIYYLFIIRRVRRLKSWTGTLENGYRVHQDKQSSSLSEK